VLSPSANSSKAVSGRSTVFCRALPVHGPRRIRSLVLAPKTGSAISAPRQIRFPHRRPWEPAVSEVAPGLRLSLGTALRSPRASPVRDGARTCGRKSGSNRGASEKKIPVQEAPGRRHSGTMSINRGFSRCLGGFEDRPRM
jgi:hypothetical protein